MAKKLARTSLRRALNSTQLEFTQRPLLSGPPEFLLPTTLPLFQNGSCLWFMFVHWVSPFQGPCHGRVWRQLALGCVVYLRPCSLVPSPGGASLAASAADPSIAGPRMTVRWRHAITNPLPSSVFFWFLADMRPPQKALKDLVLDQTIHS